MAHQEDCIKLYNSLSREIEIFQPIDPQQIRMYVCGPTVYDHAHIGNGRPIIVFDMLFRLLRHVYGPDQVRYVRNITDIDDKINQRARDENTDIGTITGRTIAQFHKDIAALAVLPPTVEPRATDHVTDIIALIQRLIARGYAYEASGHVLFQVARMPDYGRLSKRSPDELIAGARVEVAPYKRDAGDFILWKPSSPDLPGWDSPWGRGRPGWHIECSAMSWKHLGEQFDIHGGGIDLIFPHHENEIAQSRCCFDQPSMANIWMHNGFLRVEGEKMAKSAGNFITINQLVAENSFGGRSWPGEVVRLAMLLTHYRQPTDWSVQALRQAETILDGWYRAGSDQPAEQVPPSVLSALCDDLNSPAAISALHALKSDASKGDAHAAAALTAGAQFIGLRGASYQQWQESKQEAGLDPAFVEAKIADRKAARASKDWAKADAIRDLLAAKGVILMDDAEGTSWEVRR